METTLARLCSQRESATSLFPQDHKEIRARIRGYERKLQQEQDQYGMISDGYGKRYLLSPLYLHMDDLEGALAHYG